MKIETLRDPISTYEKSVKERKKLLEQNLSQVVHREEDGKKKKREQQSSPDQNQHKKEEHTIPVPSATPLQEGLGNGLDVVV